MSEVMGLCPAGCSNRISNLGSTAQRILFQRSSGRVGYYIQNLGTTDIYVGGPDVTGIGIHTGLKLCGNLTPVDGIGSQIDFGDVWVVCPAGIGDVTAIEYIRA